MIWRIISGIGSFSGVLCIWHLWHAPDFLDLAMASFACAFLSLYVMHYAIHGRDYGE